MEGRTITRADLSEAVFQEVGLSRNESSDLVETILAEVVEALARGESVKISSFGSFTVRDKGQRVGRNPKTGQEVPILPRRVLVFRASNVLKSLINGQPARHAEMRPELLHVSHEVASRVVLQVAQRHRPATAALVENDDAVVLRVKEAAMDGRRAGAGAAVEEHDRHTLGIAALLPIDRVTPVDRQHAAGVGRNLGKQVGAERSF